jgi:hypothetical protein
LDDAREIDYRFCPHCRRRLPALGSPACNYCGRPLPDDFVRARATMRQRINEADAEDLEALGREADEPLRRALRSLADLKSKTKEK